MKRFVTCRCGQSNLWSNGPAPIEPCCMQKKELTENARRKEESMSGPYIDKKLSAQECLLELLKSDRELYNKCLDTQGFAYYFNQLVNRAIVSELPKEPPKRVAREFWISPFDPGTMCGPYVFDTPCDGCIHVREVLDESDV